MEEIYSGMEERLHDIICGVIQESDCVGHCNHPPCHKVKQLTEALIRNGVIMPPCKVGDIVYYLGGISGKIVKAAKVESIYFSDCGFGFELDANGCYFDMPANKVYFTETSAKEAI